MVKNVQSWKLKAALKQNVKVRSFSGAKIADMAHYIIPSMEENALLYIVNFGTNVAIVDSVTESSKQNFPALAAEIKLAL